MKTVGERIKTLRKNEGLTQKEFANRLLISQSYLSGVEKGNETPTNKLLKLVCLEFGVREDWLLNGAGEIYDDVYEYDKADSAEMSNKALLDIFSLLVTKSNVEYGFYSLALVNFASILSEGKNYKENDGLIYSELIATFISNMERMIQCLSPHSIIDNKETVFTDDYLQGNKNLLVDGLNEIVNFLLERRAQ